MPECVPGSVMADGEEDLRDNTRLVPSVGLTNAAKSIAVNREIFSLGPSVEHLHILQGSANTLYLSSTFLLLALAFCREACHNI